MLDCLLSCLLRLKSCLLILVEMFNTGYACCGLSRARVRLHTMSLLNDLSVVIWCCVIAYSTYKQAASATDKATTYYATYDFGAAKLQAMWGKAETSGASDVNTTSIGFQVPMGAATFMYNHSSSDGRVYNLGATSTATTIASGVSAVDQAGDFIGVSYALSKRTTAYAAYYKETGNDGKGTAPANSGSSWNTTRFIVIHSF